MLQFLFASTKILFRHQTVTLRSVLICTAVFSTAPNYSFSAEDTGSVSRQIPLHIRHPYNMASDKIYAKREKYIVGLLDLALSKSGTPYSLEVVPLGIVTANRNTRNLLSGQYDICWIHTNQQREKELYPIRVPIFKGLIGWRLLMINKDRQNDFSSINTLSELKKLRAGQGHDWPDTDILRLHNFSILTSTSRNSLINMVVGKRIDYFPRSVTEIWEELEVYKNSTLAVESTIALVYPTAYYFFVAKDNEKLANALETGLKVAIEDGSFDKLFFEYYGDPIERSELDKRHVFHITNPQLSKDTPLDKPGYWYKPTTATTSIQ